MRLRLRRGDFERSATPTLEPWQSAGLRGTPAYAESFQPRSGNSNAACWATVSAQEGDIIRVWMYSPATPGYVVIDDASLALEEP